MTDKSFAQPMIQISVEELAERLVAGDASIQLVDVREPQELAIASLPGFINLPLSEFAEWNQKILAILNPEEETLVLCHHGVRSAQMCQWLVVQGFTNVKNISGGIAAYSQLVDPAIPQY
ncbi:rhodanese-related sulfurtransferase [Nostoc sp. LEGE 06077]|uniref:rhodanese-like domain-containing protein n=1 Tax=Nostoc sp. LEGE 06077 TaxID=915325 RepID=UPI001882CB47|nr:rhodanese-like domain-containing protein [Nostoc sp. LEGE 06077]MBE9208018.1 rhodanese-related sulfurtransferase [Nostoc sp. LEGE 06077]